MQGIATGFGHGFLGQIVLGGAKPAGKHQQIAALLGLYDQRPQAVGVVPDNMLMQYADAQLRQLTA